MESADPRDILDALGIDPSAADVRRGVGSTEERVAATLLGVLMIQGDGKERMPKGEPEPEEVVEERVRAMEEAKAFATAIYAAYFFPLDLCSLVTPFRAGGNYWLRPN